MVVYIEFVNGDSETFSVKDGCTYEFQYMLDSDCFRIACDDGYVWIPKNFIKSIRTMEIK